jgi:hypothetical protein
MTLRNPPLWLQAGSHTAENDRLGMQGIVGTQGTGDTLNQLKVSQSGTPGMSVQVAAGWAWVLGTTSSTQGMYSTYNDAAVTLTVTAANPTNARIDKVCLTIRDSAYAGASNDSILQVVAGTPSASPTAPATPASSLVLATISVAAGATSIVDANITDARTKAAMSLAGTGATGGGSDQVFYENGVAVTANYTISASKNAGTFGPVTINGGVTVTVPAGSVWSVV